MISDRIAVERRSEQVALFKARIAVLFERLPVLCGFYVTEDLGIAEIAVQEWPGGLPSLRELGAAICAALTEVIDDTEEGVELIRGKVFARAIH
jgi:hypothetical protein